MSTTPLIVLPGQGGNFWLVGDQITFKLTGEHTRGAFALAEDYITPDQGPPPHVHHREHECFYVLSGQFFFASGDRALIATAGTAVFLPKDVPHVFKNVGAEAGRFLLLAAPAGFEKMAAEAGEAVPQIPFDKAIGKSDIDKLMATLPKYGLKLAIDWQPAKPAPAPATDRKLAVMGNEITIKLTAEQTGGVLTLVEIATPPGQGVPAHSHRDLDEVFYVLEGEWEFTIAGETYRPAPGTTLHLPPGVTHGFRNVGAALARMVDYHLPGGFDTFFEEAATIPAGPPDPAAVRALMDKHGMDMPT